MGETVKDIPDNFEARLAMLKAEGAAKAAFAAASDPSAAAASAAPLMPFERAQSLATADALERTFSCYSVFPLSLCEMHPSESAPAVGPPYVTCAPYFSHST